MLQSSCLVLPKKALYLQHETYNALGQMSQKKINSENGSTWLQTEDFAYNIRGALTAINDPAAPIQP